MWLWMLPLLSTSHAILAESSLSTWIPVLLCSGVPKWGRACSHAQRPPHSPPSSHHCRHLPVVSAPLSAASQSTLLLADPWWQAGTVPTQAFNPPSLLAFPKYFPHRCRWWGISHLLKILLVLLLCFTVFPSRCHNFLISCGRVALPAYLHC